MKTIIACILVLLFFPGRAQQFLFNEFTLSGNRTLVADANTQNRLGFGAGIYHVFKRDALFSPYLGFEYNMASQFKSKVAEKFHTLAYDVTYYVHGISIPFAMRMNLGMRHLFFIDAGGYADLNFYAEQSGRAKSIVLYTNYDITGPANLTGPDAGFSVGGGIALPRGKNRLFVKAEYKHGFINIGFEPTSVYNRYFRLMAGFSI